MRKIFTTIACACSFLCVQAQQNSIDSLKNLLFNAREDSIRLKLLLKLSYDLQQTKTDSALSYAEQAFKLAQASNNVKEELEALGRMAEAHTFAGNFSGALENAFTGLKKSEALNDEELIAESHLGVAFVYGVQGDFQQAIPYFLRAEDFFRKTKNEIFLENTLVNTANCYREMNKLDSARIYINEALELSLRLKDNQGIGACYLNLGMIYTKMRLYDLAKNYLYISLPYFISDNHLFIASVQCALAEVFDSTGRIDSAFFYARESYRRAKIMGSPDVIIFPSKQLVSLFRKTHQADSALFYQDVVMQIKDSASNMEKQKRLQSITFQEKLNQMEKDREKTQLVEARKRNLQIAGVAAFIPLFFGFVLLLSRRQIRPRAVEILGILFLLFVFEFITLYFHPIVGKWTHESPIWMLLIFVAIAFILVPLHHRSENWIKEKLALQRIKELEKRVRMGEEAQKKLSQ